MHCFHQVWPSYCLIRITKGYALQDQELGNCACRCRRPCQSLERIEHTRNKDQTKNRASKKGVSLLDINRVCLRFHDIRGIGDDFDCLTKSSHATVNTMVEAHTSAQLVRHRLNARRCMEIYNDPKTSPSSLNPIPSALIRSPFSADHHANLFTKSYAFNHAINAFISPIRSPVLP